jgi:lysozyme
MLYGVDVSYAQGETIDWSQVKGAGIDFAYSRACYGSNPADDDGPVYVANHDGCKANGIPFGAYIFFLLTEDPVAQAQHFLSIIDGMQGQLRPMVDVEEGSGTTGSTYGNIDALAAFNAAIKTGLGCDPVIYTNADTWDGAFGGTDAFSGHSLWVASFTGTPGNPTMPQGWSTYTVQQYSDQGNIAGIPGSVDLDCLNGDNLEVISR